MDANHTKRLKELSEKGKLSATEKKELKALEAYKVECEKEPAKPAEEAKADAPKADAKPAGDAKPEAKK